MASLSRASTAASSGLSLPEFLNDLASLDLVDGVECLDGVDLVFAAAIAQHQYEGIEGTRLLQRLYEFPRRLFALN